MVIKRNKTEEGDLNPLRDGFCLIYMLCLHIKDIRLLSALLSYFAGYLSELALVELFCGSVLWFSRRPEILTCVLVAGKYLIVQKLELIHLCCSGYDWHCTPKQNQNWHVLKDSWIQKHKQMPAYSLWLVIWSLNGIHGRWRSLRIGVGRGALGERWVQTRLENHMAVLISCR